MKLAKTIGTLAALAIFLGACNNFFHDLIPPDGDRITSFDLPGQTAGAVIGENTVNVLVRPGTDLHSLLPSVSVSPGAVVIPVTFDYVAAAFPDVDLISEVLALHAAPDFNEHVRNLIRQTPGFNVPALDIPIDFSGPVNFFVISGQGSIREYVVRVDVDSYEPRILSLRFTKYDNPELLTDAVPVFAGSVLHVTAMYPVELPLSFAIVPSFEILGERIEIDGVEIRPGRDAIQFSPVLDLPQTKTLTVTRGDRIKDYTLLVTFREDPDTIRSITDFRFNWLDNPSIAATSVASIVNDGDFGTITLQVLYSGARPSVLVPRFISPGTVRVAGTLQTSGTDGHDFSAPLEYRVVSRNLQFSRTYTVRVNFISMADGAPRMLSFGLSQAHNPGLIRDGSGEIGGGHIIVDVHFGGTVAPETLVPEFVAQGVVTVQGSVQLSGVSPQNFVGHITYVVTNPLNPMLRSYYSVRTRLVRDTSSDAVITSFGFFPEENPWLDEPLVGRIQQDTITVFGPPGVRERAMVPRFTATGQVSVDGTVQVSGVTGLVFDGSVGYTVVSANGLHSRTYTVSVRELLSPRIFVDQNAAGHNDGTSWQNAFRCLREASEAAAFLSPDEPTEIWIARGTYRAGDGYFLLTPNVSFIGGFAGWETISGQRNPGANRTVLSGDLGGGRRSLNLFAAPGTVDGDVVFLDLEFAFAESAILAGLTDRGRLTVRDAVFTDLRGDAVVLSGSSGATISGATIGGVGGSGIRIYGAAGLVEVSELSLRDVSRDGVAVSGGSGDRRFAGVYGRGVGNSVVAVNAANNSGVFVRDAELRDVSGSAICITGATNRIEIDDVRMRDVAGYGVRICERSYLDIWGGVGNLFNLPRISGSIRISGVSGHNVGGGIYIPLSTLSNPNIDVHNTEIRDVSGITGVRVTGAAAADIRNVHVANAPMARGFHVAAGAGTATFFNSSVGNVGTYGIWASAGNVEIINIAVEEASIGLAVSTTAAGQRRLAVSNTTIRNLGSTGIRVGSVFDDIAVSGTIIENTGGRGIVKAQTSTGARNVNFELRDSVIRNTTSAYCSWVGTPAGAGGGVFFNQPPSAGFASSLTVLRTRFENNTAGGTGGAILAGVTTLDVRDSEFRNSTAAGNAGAIMALAIVADFTVTGTNFIGSSSGASGGAINIAGGSDRTNFVISGSSRFEGSRAATGGGAVTANNANVTVRDSVFVDSGSVGQGGTFNITNSNSTLAISGSHFENSSGGTGGAIRFVGGTGTVTNSVFRNVHGGQGGVIDASSSATTLAISGSHFENSSGTNGGAIAAGGALAITNSRFVNNSATGSGGAIHLLALASTTLTITGSHFENSRAGSNGGAISGGLAGVTNFFIQDTRFYNATAAGAVKMFNLTGASATFTGCVFVHDNRLQQFAPPSAVDADRTMFQFNFGGGAAVFDGCTFTNLASNSPRDAYIFNRVSQSPGHPSLPSGQALTVRTSPFNLTLRNSIFNFAPNQRMGLLFLHGGQQPGATGAAVLAVDHLLMDGVTVNGGGALQPVIRLHHVANGTSTPGTFRLRPNNVLNGQLLNTQQALAGLGAGIINLTGGAMPVLVP